MAIGRVIICPHCKEGHQSSNPARWGGCCITCALNVCISCGEEEEAHLFDVLPHGKCVYNSTVYTTAWAASEAYRDAPP